MSEAVIRSSVADQVAERLREGLASGRWGTELPSEADLCRDFQVSRVTLRKSIAQLVREKRLEPGGRGRHHRILHPAWQPPARSGSIIRILTPYSPVTLDTAHLVMFDKLRERAGAAGYGVEYEHQPKLFSARRPTGFGRLDLLPDTAGWVLFFSTHALQKWFSARGQPGVIVGPAYPEINLPSIHPDTEASARHAAGLFHARGHRRMAYLLPEFTSLGDRLGSIAFADEARRLGPEACIAPYQPEIAGLRRALDHLLVTRPRPTAFFSNCAEHSITILGHLQNAGLRIPQDAAIISGWDNPFLDHAVPSIARYRIDRARTGRKIIGLLLDVLRNGTGKCTRVKVLPDFVPGGTFR